MPQKRHGRALSLTAAKKLYYGQELYHRTETQGGGTMPLRVRVTGAVKLWKTRPTHFRVPIKHGLYQSGEITHENKDDWTLTQWEPKQPKRRGRRASCKRVSFTRATGERVNFTACGDKGNRSAGQRVKNEDVAAAWSRGQAKAAGHFHTDGQNLYSYGLLVGATKRGSKIAFDYTAGSGNFESQTTSTHVGRAKRYADEVRIP